MIKYRVDRGNGFHEVSSLIEAQNYCNEHNLPQNIQEINFEPDLEPDYRPKLTGYEFAAILRGLFLDRPIPLRVALVDKTYSTLYVLENDNIITQTDVDDVIYLLRNQTLGLLTTEEFNLFEQKTLESLNNFNIT